MNLYVSVIGILDGSTAARCSFPAVRDCSGSGRQLLTRAKVLTDVGLTCVRSVFRLAVTASVVERMMEKNTTNKNGKTDSTIGLNLLLLL